MTLADALVEYVVVRLRRWFSTRSACARARAAGEHLIIVMHASLDHTDWAALGEAEFYHVRRTPHRLHSGNAARPEGLVKSRLPPTRLNVWAGCLTCRCTSWCRPGSSRKFSLVKPQPA